MNKMVEIKPEAKALIVIPEADILTVFTGDFATQFEPHLAKLRTIVAEFQLTSRDASLEKDREEIEDFAWQLLKTRTAIEGHRKILADRLKALPKKNDENGRTMRVAIEEMESAVLEPVVAWKAKEKARVDARVAAIENVKALGAPDIATLTVDQIMWRMRGVESHAPMDEMRDEFADEYERTQRVALGALGAALVARRKLDADQTELAALRKLQAERDAKDAAERAEREKADREREATEGARQAEIDAANRAKERAESEAREAIAKAERDRLAAELAAAEQQRRRLEAEAQARYVADTLAAEKARIEAAKQKAAEDAERARAESIEHQRKVNRAIVDALTEILVSETGAKAVVRAVAAGKIPRLTINY